MDKHKHKHTPGPYWMAADRNPPDGDDREVWDVGAGDECLAYFERREDALLYRAAPDMLAALEAIVSRYAPSADPANDAVSRMWGNARAAIAKARGEG